MWTPSDGAATVPLRFTYSCEGPQHVELLEGAPGSLWDGNDLPGLHHVGVWVDDVAAETGRLVEGGWRVDGAERAPEDGYGVMSYVRSLCGGGVGLAPGQVGPAFERWWAGGALRGRGDRSAVPAVRLPARGRPRLCHPGAGRGRHRLTGGGPDALPPVAHASLRLSPT